MPVFQLTRRRVFPPPEFARPDGLLAVGGDLSRERLLEAYRRGIFPWYGEGGPILWWSPDPRCVLFPERLHVSRRFERVLKQGTFTVTFNAAFPQVLAACAQFRGPRRTSTWITSEMCRAYTRLHETGHAHSVEVWADGELAGGLYGVALGRCFSGESMFSGKPDASKVALHALVERLRGLDSALIDCQMASDHFLRLGACEIPRSEFLERLERAIALSTPDGLWHG